MRKRIRFSIDVDLFHHSILVSVGESDKALFEYLKRVGVNDEECEALIFPEGIVGLALLTGANRAIIRLKYCADKYEMIDHITHEVSHIVVDILEKIGVKLKNHTSDEVYSYMIGFYTSQICRELKI